MRLYQYKKRRKPKSKSSVDFLAEDGLREYQKFTEAIDKAEEDGHNVLFAEKSDKKGTKFGTRGNGISWYVYITIIVSILLYIKFF